MPKDYSRALRLAEQIHRDLSVLISREVKDPRVGMVTIGDVEVSSDLSHAKVYYTLLGGLGDPEETQLGLEKASGFLRSRLGKALRVRFTPELHFIHDETEERGQALEALIAKARARDEQGKT
ncbi:MAG TPA: 30S ribosome-binding factor RbfA [Gammaproteobacteria bacterium]|nr:30S ribosome-binding factor RbfA [Gammaproteobacteria bacterium]